MLGLGIMKKFNANFLEPPKQQLNDLLEYYRAGRFADAEKLSLSVTQEFPEHPFAWKVLGAILKQTNRISESLVASQKSVQLEPQDAESQYNLGNTLKVLTRLNDAEVSYRKAIALKPDFAEAYNNLGITLKEVGKLNDAEVSYRKAIALKPDYAEAYNNLGNTLKVLTRLNEAEVSYRKAIALKADYAEAHYNLGNILKEVGKLNEAEINLRQAIELKADYAEAHFDLGMVLFSMSDFKNGLIQYEWRKKLPQNINNYKNIKGLEWQGENLNNKTILILSEQGIGDIIQFSRYIYLIEKEYSVNIIFKTYKRMPYLFSKSKFKIIFNEDNIPKYDFYKHLMSLPKIYYEKTKTFPSQINFIPKDKKIALKWKERLNEIKGFKVGINWQGSKTYKSDDLRSIPLNYFNDLFNIE